MAKYTAKTTEVEAVQWDKDSSNTIELLTQFQAAIYEWNNSPSNMYLRIATIDGVMEARPGDWFITDPKGSVSIRTDEQFAAQFSA